MTVDLGAIADRGREVITAALETSRTRGTILRETNDADSTVDFETLELTNPTPAKAIATNVRAVVIGVGADGQELGAARIHSATTFLILFPITVTDLQDEDVFRVDRNPDARLVGAQLLITEVGDDGLAVVRRVSARRL